jgi:uncharacterized protein VirK/YbjX
MHKDAHLLDVCHREADFVDARSQAFKTSKLKTNYAKFWKSAGGICGKKIKMQSRYVIIPIKKSAHNLKFVIHSAHYNG